MNDIDPENELDDRTEAGLRDLIRDNPELLKRTLDDLGYLPVGNAEADQPASSEDLPPVLERLNEIVQEIGSPQTAEEIVEYIEDQHPDFRDEYKSAQHRSWVSTQLNKLVEKGAVGRFRDGRVIRYVASPAEAIRHWALHNNQFVEDLERSDLHNISDDTGMPIRVVREALDELLEENDD